jgi:Type IV secretion-system coupling protein DNA-binding domain
MEQEQPVRVGRRLSAIVAADVAGYSRLMGLDEVGTARTLREHRAVTDALVAKHGGRLVKTTGDGVLLEFSSVVDAIECAVAVQAVMAERNEGVSADRRCRRSPRVFGGALTELLAESRKYGLSLVLANQNIAQLSGRTSKTLVDAVVGNVANLLVLRVGVKDAELLEPWFRPHITWNDLVGMPDFTAAVRILDGNRPTTPIVIELLPLPPAGEVSIGKSIIASSRATLCRLRDEVDANFNAR